MKPTAEIIPIEDVYSTKSSGSGGGFNYFNGMAIGTVFSCSYNMETGSLLYDYVLCSKQGVTVLLKSMDTGRFERHIGQKFWQQHTMVQILHDPTKEEQENGTSA